MEFSDLKEIAKLIIENDIKIIFIETPCNPNMILTSISVFNHIRNELNRNILIFVDNTMAGPIFLKPLDHGADICIYSATKFSWDILILLLDVYLDQMN